MCACVCVGVCVGVGVCVCVCVSEWMCVLYMYLIIWNKTIWPACLKFFCVRHVPHCVIGGTENILHIKRWEEEGDGGGWEGSSAHLLPPEQVAVNQDKTSQQLAALRAHIQELELELQEFKSGRVVVSEDGSVVMNDMATEITMLRTENDK